MRDHPVIIAHQQDGFGSLNAYRVMIKGFLDQVQTVEIFGYVPHRCIYFSPLNPRQRFVIRQVNAFNILPGKYHFREQTLIGRTRVQTNTTDVLFFAFAINQLMPVNVRTGSQHHCRSDFAIAQVAFCGKMGDDRHVINAVDQAFNADICTAHMGVIEWVTLKLGLKRAGQSFIQSGVGQWHGTHNIADIRLLQQGRIIHVAKQGAIPAATLQRNARGGFQGLQGVLYHADREIQFAGQLINGFQTGTRCQSEQVACQAD
ncbi:hypothetical protein D3C75_782610 [compost metagenome]